MKNSLQKSLYAADTRSMERHLHLVHSVTASSEPEGNVTTLDLEETNVVDLETERARRRYHPAAGSAWLSTLFDDDDLDPVC